MTPAVRFAGTRYAGEYCFHFLIVWLEFGAWFVWLAAQSWFRRVATTPDFPAVQGVLVGLGLFIAGARPTSAHHNAQAETQHAMRGAE